MKTLLFIFIVCIVPLSYAEDSYKDNAEVQQFIATMAKEDGLKKSDLEYIFSRVERNDRVIELISNSPEKKMNWGEYKNIFLNEKRIRLGREFMKEHKVNLEKATKKYGIPKHIITAIMGIETYYGRQTGGHKVIQSLTTLAFDYPPRQKFFRSELKHFLRLAFQQKLDPLTLTGSYAGAMGYPQFMPSSYQQYAVDFDGNDTIDIWNGEADAIGSVANYLYRHGWKKNQSVAFLVHPKNNTVFEKLSSNLKPNISLNQLEKTGIEIDQLSPEQVYSAIILNGVTPVQYWIGSYNFYVISRYNPSYLYTMAVYKLSQLILS